MLLLLRPPALQTRSARWASNRRGCSSGKRKKPGTYAADTETAISDRNQAYEDAADVGANLGDAVVGKVKFNLLTGVVTFNGRPLNDPQREAISAGCRCIVGGSR